MISVLGGFNVKSNIWCNNDTTTHEGSMIDSVASNYGLRQLIQEATHIINSFSFCNDLIFTSQSDLVSRGIRSPLIFTSKMSSSGSLCKI